ncbi:MAG: ABC transporter permease [Actinomycetota bacterium]|nr:ABC transporter permease [Actinomycetota bacterium]
MNAAYAVTLAVGIIALRLGLRQRTRRRAAEPTRTSNPRRSVLEALLGDVGLVARREIRERVRGRIFQVGTVLILLVVAGAIVIPVLSASTSHPPRAGVLGQLTPPLQAALTSTATSLGTSVTLVPEASVAAAEADLTRGHLDLVVEANQLLVDKPLVASNGSTTAQFVRAAARALGTEQAYVAAGLSPTQAGILAQAKQLPVTSLHPGSAKGATRTTSFVALILVFVMLAQYNTWTLMGVAEEKSSRVVEVLLAALRPRQLLAGKVLGIGLVAFAQASTIVVFALGLAHVVGSDLLHGTGTLALVSALVWLVLGYAFYCWVYAAAGSTAERQEQVQTLAFPLTLPLILGYVMSITAATTGNASTFFTILAYLPPTAPFAMPVLVGLGKATWWQFGASAAISLASTVLVARLATGVYRRSILRTGRRVRLLSATSGE